MKRNGKAKQYIEKPWIDIVEKSHGEEKEMFMKQYEKMGFDTEAALKWVAECTTRNCRECPAYKTQNWGDAGTECVSKYLLSDVPEPPKVPRWQTARTNEDIFKLYKEFLDFCSYAGGCFNKDDGKNCPYAIQRLSHQCGCVFAFLLDLVEAPEVEE